jgi:hypothetical protein
MAGRCLLEHHGEWKYITTGSCYQVRVCERCNRESRRGPEHQPGQWEFPGESSCDQVRICQRCSQVAARHTEHNFGPWEPDDSGSGSNCDISRTCWRCYKISKMTVHEYHWEYIGNSCKQEHVCISCRLPSPLAPEIMRHAWTDWNLNQDYATRICRRCGVEQEKKTLRLVINNPTVPEVPITSAP